LESRRPPGDIARVEVLLEVGGDLKLTNEGKTESVKMAVTGKLSYDEKRLPPLKKDDTKSLRAVRRYQTAEATIQIEKKTLKPTLRDQRRLVAMVEDREQVQIFSPEGPLTRDELDLVDVPGNSMLLDRLLPEGAVALGDRWKHSDTLLAALLGLDAVSETDVTSELKDVDASAARMELSGTVQGAIDGVSTELELKARYKFNREEGTVTWFAMLIQEKRSVGHVGPGLDIVARLQMTVAPGKECLELLDEALAEAPLQGKPEQMILEYTATGGNFGFHYDRRWHLTNDKTDGLAMRLVDRGDLLAQCNVSQLAPVDADKLPNLETFQHDVQKALDKNFGQFLEVGESRNSQGYTVYQVAVEGKASDLPILWNYFYLADQQGHAVVFAFTVERSQAELLGKIDQSIVDSLQIKPVSETAAQPTLAPTLK
jgi:hypothetical protein